MGLFDRVQNSCKGEGGLEPYFYALSLYYFSAYVPCSMCAKFKLFIVITKFCFIETNLYHLEVNFICHNIKN